MPTEEDIILPPIHAHAARIELQDLILSKEWVETFLILKSAPLDTPPTEQLSPLGLALIASYYNNKGDQCCPIYIASTKQDFIDIVKVVNAAKTDTKLVVIFQPTDNRGADEDYFNSFHKTVVLLEKRHFLLHILNADSTPIKNHTDVVFDLAEKAIGNTHQARYRLAPLLHPRRAEPFPLFIQRCWFDCGTHALRMARAIAKNPSFLDEVKSISYIRSENELYNFEYQLPMSLARSIDSSIVREQALKLYAEDSTQLAQHFDRYPQRLQYSQQFLRKYIELATKLFNETAPDTLIANIDQADAKNYKTQNGALALLNT